MVNNRFMGRRGRLADDEIADLADDRRDGLIYGQHAGYAFEVDR